jgi:hypothetical protein
MSQKASYAERHYAECRIKPLMLSVIMLNVITLSFMVDMLIIYLYEKVDITFKKVYNLKIV